MTDAPQPIPHFGRFITLLLAKGYQHNPCSGHCHDHGDSGHAHLRTPEGEDILVWADGRWSGYDLTLPAPNVYAPVPERLRPKGWRVG